MMAEHFAFLLALTMVFAVTASVLAEGETYLWDNFDDRDPQAKPDLAPNGAHLWWITSTTCVPRMRMVR